MDHFCVWEFCFLSFWERHLSDGISVKSEEKIDDYCERSGSLATGTIMNFIRRDIVYLPLNVQDRRRFEEKLPSVRRSMTE